MDVKWLHRIQQSLSSQMARVGQGARNLRSRLSSHAERAAEERAPTSLANRLLLLQIVWAVLFGLLIITALWWGAGRIIEQSFQFQGEGWIKKLDELATPLYTSDDRSNFAETVEYLKNFPEIASVQYYDEEGGSIVAEYYRNNKSAVPHSFSEQELQILKATNVETKPQLFTSSESSAIFHISAPIWVKSVMNDGMYNFSLERPVNESVEILGVLRVGLDYSLYQKDLNKNIVYVSTLIVLLLTVAAIIGRILIRWALRPLLQLEEPLNKLAKGEIDVEVEGGGDREIVQIGKALNTTISALRERDEILRKMANHDHLTGLVNRNYFTEKLEAEIRRIGKDGGSSALFFIDLDRFKFINDTYGHVAGDRLLLAVANLLKKRVRDGDLVSRFGGDEFTALVYRVDSKQAQDIADSLLQLMRKFDFHEAGETLHIYFSIGITVFDSGLQTAHDIVMQADAAVREAKKDGRNRYHLFDSAHDGAVVFKDQGWHGRISRMLQKQELLLYYQPLKALSREAEMLCEVLPQMPGKANEILPPSAFFPAAERYGLMAEIDRMVIRKALRWLAGSNEKKVALAINLSQQSFDDDWLLKKLPKELQQHGIAAERIIIEVSEAVLLRNSEKLRPVMQHLNQQGVRFAIDDVGLGCGSFNYLKEYPIAMLKIDHRLVESLSSDALAQISVQSLVEVAQLMNLQTVAKFVPDDITLHKLRSMGVDYGQGNFFCEAQPTAQHKGPDFSLVR